MTPVAGVLVIDKPEGPTSHDLVAMARRALGERRIGHCGTLDPMATGVLAMAVGPATRLVQYLTSDEKHYDAAIRFGCVTDTYDRLGEVVSESAARPTLEDIERALTAFRGPFAQRPPAFSAKKVGGVRAHELARRDRGATLELQPADVTVHGLEVRTFDGHVLRVSLRVSAGFYVRSLAHDLGQALGMGAVLDELRRTASGSFDLGSAVTVTDLATTSREALLRRLTPLEGLLPHLPAVHLTAEQAVRVRHGQDLDASVLDPAIAGPDGLPALVRMRDPDGHLMALATPAGRAGFLHPSVVLG